MAVERVITLNHDSVWSMVTNSRHITIDEMKQEVQRRLRPPASDDIVVENDTLTVTVADPFSSRLFVVPVRARDCRHLECIDLKNWLETRPGKSARKPTEPTMVDVWSCPICGCDARPSRLRVDDFFVEVRNKLLERSNVSVKKIEISANGTWTAIEEPEEIDDGTPDPGKTEATWRVSVAPAAPAGSGVPETIEILDDD
ncbi:E3 SUMO-protein ligase gei-17 [Cladobotryum mycophilum]|uniref:E3 SUMO-protein ligase gei-17 n=1 Tax=Cladobotryum mycophilum TaxID=491253 RepID=A0ABR0S5J5_9HYPO